MGILFRVTLILLVPHLYLAHQYHVLGIPTSINARLYANDAKNCTGPGDEGRMAFRTFIETLHVVGYALSALMLAMALGVFFIFKTQSSVRVSLHKSLFFSSAVSGVLWIIWDQFITKNEELLRENPFWCQMFHLLLQYYEVSTYVWMAMESVFLYLSIVKVFFDEELARKICMYIGFGVPVIFDFSYAAIRLYSDDTLSCMCELPTMPVNIIEIPIWCSVMLCLGITVIAIYVTLKKNRNSYGKLRKTKLTIRRSLALFPVFGLHLLLHFIKPPQDTLVYEIHEIVLAVLTSFQGFYLAMFFCFTNPEVLAHLKRYYEQRRAMNSLPKRTDNDV